MVAACTAVGMENRAAANLSFREEEMGNSEKLFILLSCWLSATRPAQTFVRDSTASGPVLLLDYAENMRRELRAGILGSTIEQRDRTTQPKVISAK